jgi:hypothetical protein
MTSQIAAPVPHAAAKTSDDSGKLKILLGILRK